MLNETCSDQFVSQCVITEDTSTSFLFSSGEGLKKKSNNFLKTKFCQTFRQKIRFRTVCYIQNPFEESWQVLKRRNDCRLIIFLMYGTSLENLFSLWNVITM